LSSRSKIPVLRRHGFQKQNTGIKKTWMGGWGGKKKHGICRQNMAKNMAGEGLGSSTLLRSTTEELELTHVGFIKELHHHWFRYNVAPSITAIVEKPIALYRFCGMGTIRRMQTHRKNSMVR
jgi:hypothetical protein